MSAPTEAEPEPKEIRASLTERDLSSSAGVARALMRTTGLDVDTLRAAASEGRISLPLSAATREQLERAAAKRARRAACRR